MKDNGQIFAERVEARMKLKGPQVGDYLLSEKGYTRFTHKWDDIMQTGGSEFGQFYLNDSGRCSYSGGLNSGISRDEIVLTDETKEGKVWFFDRDISGADRGINVMIKCRVWKAIDGADLSRV